MVETIINIRIMIIEYKSYMYIKSLIKYLLLNFISFQHLFYNLLLKVFHYFLTFQDTLYRLNKVFAI